MELREWIRREQRATYKKVEEYGAQCPPIPQTRPTYNPEYYFGYYNGYLTALYNLNKKLIEDS